MSGVVMRMGPALLILLSGFVGGHAVRAQNVAPVVAGLAAGAGASQAQTSTLSPDPELGRDLDAFADRSLSGTSRLSCECGAATEVRISSTPLFNYANIALTNESGGLLSITPGSARVRFGDGRVRRLGRLVPSDIVVQEGWWVQFALRFPEKSDFKDQTSFEVDLEVLDDSRVPCTITTRFERDLTLSYDARIFTPHWSFETEVAAGARLLTTSGVQKLGADYAPMLAVGFAYYPSLRHGIRLDLLGGTYGGDGVDHVVSEYKFDGKPRLTAIESFVSYSARLPLPRRLQATYNPGVGVYSVELMDDSEAPIRSKAVVALRHQLRTALTVANLDPSSDIALGLSLNHLWVPYGRIGRADLEGHSLGVMFHIICGGGTVR